MTVTSSPVIPHRALDASLSPHVHTSLKCYSKSLRERKYRTRHHIDGGIIRTYRIILLTQMQILSSPARTTRETWIAYCLSHYSATNSWGRFTSLCLGTYHSVPQNPTFMLLLVCSNLLHLSYGGVHCAWSFFPPLSHLPRLAALHIRSLIYDEVPCNTNRQYRKEFQWTTRRKPTKRSRHVTRIIPVNFRAHDHSAYVTFSQDLY